MAEYINSFGDFIKNLTANSQIKEQAQVPIDPQLKSKYDDLLRLKTELLTLENQLIAKKNEVSRVEKEYQATVIQTNAIQVNKEQQAQPAQVQPAPQIPA